MPDSHPHLVVIGLGLVGAAAVRHAAASGVEVVGIGPAEPDDWTTHTGAFASHYDSGRITRLLDVSLVWSELARRSIAAYPTITSRSGIDFHRPVGVAWLGSRPGGLGALTASGRVLGIPTDPVPATSFSHTHLAVGSGEVLLEAAPAGHIDPRAMLSAQLAVAASSGATLLRDEVVGIDHTASHVEVSTKGGRRFVADAVVVAAGAYSGHLAAGGLPIAATTEAVVLGEVDDATATALAELPSVIRLADGVDLDVYLVPPVRYPDGRWYVKLGAETPGDHVLASPAEIGAWMSGTAAESRRDVLIGHLTSMLPEVPIRRFLVKPCVYARTASGRPYVDHLAPGVVVAAGGNGRAAKSADAIGALAVALAMDGSWSDGLDPADFALP